LNNESFNFLSGSKKRLWGIFSIKVYPENAGGFYRTTVHPLPSESLGLVTQYPILVQKLNNIEQLDQTSTTPHRYLQVQ